jgi:hypothetical protein
LFLSVVEFSLFMEDICVLPVDVSEIRGHNVNIITNLQSLSQSLLQFIILPKLHQRSLYSLLLHYLFFFYFFFLFLNLISILIFLILCFSLVNKLLGFINSFFLPLSFLLKGVFLCLLLGQVSFRWFFTSECWMNEKGLITHIK